MHISDIEIPANPSLVIQPSVLFDHPEHAAAVAVIIGSWAEIESKLEGIFVTLVGDELKLAEFKAERGWDARVKNMVAAVKETRGDHAAIKLKAILSTAATASKKRNEVAHGFWGSCKERPNDLVLFSEELWVEAARTAQRAQAAGSNRIMPDEKQIRSSGRIVTIDQLRIAIEEVEHARGLVGDFWNDEMPAVVKVNSHVPSARPEDDPQVADRIKNAVRSLKLQKKAASRAQQEAETQGSNEQPH